MQPYTFPYIGYFQLIEAVDSFVFYDDVNFIKGGWIHRNRLLVNHTDNLFTIPLLKASSFKSINKVEINSIIFDNWKRKFFKTIKLSYSKAPYYNEVLPVIERVFSNEEYATIDCLASKSIKEVCKYLGINKQWYYSSNHFTNSLNMGRTERLLHIANSLGCNTYINTIGGEKLYEKNDFIKNGVTLHFIKLEEVSYTQYSNNFVPNLSIIDVMMFNSIEDIHLLLKKYSLIG